MLRLGRGAGHILDVLDVLHRDQLALRIRDGACSAMDLGARHPRTGELLPALKFTVQTLATGELQHDLHHTVTEEDAPAPELPVALDMPGKVADFLRTADPQGAPSPGPVARRAGSPQVGRGTTWGLPVWGVRPGVRPGRRVLPSPTAGSPPGRGSGRSS